MSSITPIEVFQDQPVEYEQLASGAFIITEKFPEATREELLLESRELINDVVSKDENLGMLYESDGQSGEISLTGLGSTPDTITGVRITPAADGEKEGALVVFRSAYGNVSEDNPAIVVEIGPEGRLVTYKWSSSAVDKVPISEKEAVTFVREILSKAQDTFLDKDD